MINDEIVIKMTDPMERPMPAVTFALDKTKRTVYLHGNDFTLIFSPAALLKMFETALQ